MQKITKKEMFNLIKVQVADNAEMVAFIDHEIELLEKKASKKGETATQKANVGLKAIIVEALGNANAPMTVTEILKSDERLAELSNQKVSALLKQLVETNEVVKTIDKKKSFFSLA